MSFPLLLVNLSLLILFVYFLVSVLCFFFDGSLRLSLFLALKGDSKKITITFCYRKVARAITKWGAIEKSPILLSQYWKSDQIFRFLMVAIIFSPTVHHTFSKEFLCIIWFCQFANFIPTYCNTISSKELSIDSLKMQERWWLLH